MFKKGFPITFLWQSETFGSYMDDSAIAAAKAEPSKPIDRNILDYTGDDDFVWKPGGVIFLLKLF